MTTGKGKLSYSQRELFSHLLPEIFKTNLKRFLIFFTFLALENWIRAKTFLWRKIDGIISV